MTKENKPQTKKSFSPDWLVSGVLTKLGDTFDRLTGRGWNPSSSLATSKLIDKLKFLLDSEIRDLGRKGKFVPHVIKLKIQWDKFSTDSEDSLDKLKFELHAAAIDHINDRLYHTYAPMDIKIKTDYFTDGVKMLSSFGKYSDKEDDEVSVNVTVPNMRIDDLITDGKIKVNLNEEKPTLVEDIFIVRYSSKNKEREIELNFTQNKRVSVGRSSRNQIVIDDNSVSKIHAALVLNDEKQLMVADTGSTNGTFINEKRIAYGKAIMFEDDAKLKFGTVEVLFERLETFVEEEIFQELEEPESEEEILATEAAINLEENESVQLPQNNDSPVQTIEPKTQKPDLTLQMNEKQIVQPIKTQASINKNEIDLEDSLEGEEFESQSEIEKENDSEVVNLENTQDWEV